MKIDVRYNEFSNWPQPVNVLTRHDGAVVWCNHADCEAEEADLGHYDPKFGDWSDDWQRISVCTSCGSWKREEDEVWNERF